MVMDTRIRDLATAIGTEVKGKASSAALALTNAEVSRNAMNEATNSIPNAALRDVAGGIAAGWARNGTASATNVVNVPQYAGLAWKIDGVGSQVGVYSPYFDVVPGETYNFTATLMGMLTGSTGVVFRVEYRDLANVGVTPTFVQNVTLPGASTLQNYSLRVTIPANAVTARIFLLHGANATGSSWYAGNLGFRRVADEIAGTGYLSDASLKSTYPVYRIKSGGTYPARIAGAVNIFFGDTDPGLAMAAGDYWVNPAVTTLGEVTAAVLNQSTALYAAVQATTRGNTVDLPLVPRQEEPALFKRTGIGGLYGWECAPSATTTLAANIKIPYGWSTGRVRVFFVRTSGATADIRLTRDGAAYRDGAAARSFGSVTNTVSTAAANTVKSVLITSNMDLTMMDSVSVEVQRTGTSTLDTFAAPIYILNAQLEKIA